MNNSLFHDFEKFFNFPVVSFFETDEVDRFHSTAAIRIQTEDGNDFYKVKAALPGIKKEEINISYNDRYLTIKGNKSVEKKKDASYFLSERQGFEFNQRVYIAYEVDSENFEAKLSNGILEISLPKIAKESAKKIDITH